MQDSAGSARHPRRQQTAILQIKLLVAAIGQTASEVFALLRELNREEGMTFLIVTHDPRLADSCNQQFYLQDGRLLPPGMTC